MSVSPGQRAFQILSSRHVKNFVEHVFHKYRVRIFCIDTEMTGESAIESGALVLMNVLTGRWSAKLRAKFVIELLDVAPIATKAREWRDERGRNILHLMCLKFDYATIKMVVEKLGDELIHEKDNNGKYPVTYLLQNQHPKRSDGIAALLDLMSKNNTAPLIQIKDEVIARISTGKLLSKQPCTKEMVIYALDHFATREIYTDEDRKKVIALFRPRKGFFGEPGINGHAIHAVTLMKPPIDEIDHIYEVIFKDKSMLDMLLNWKPNFLDFVLRNKSPGIDTLKREFEAFLPKSCDRALVNIDHTQLFLTALRMYDPLTFTPILEIIEARTTHSLLIIAVMVKNITKLPKQYVHALAPFKNSWIQSPVSSSDETTHSIFPIEDLPLEMVMNIISFLSHQTATALSLVNKQFNKYINNSSVWIQMYSKYFPLNTTVPNSADLYSRDTFYRHYNEKFRRKWQPTHVPLSAVTGSLISLDLKEETLVYSSTYYIGVCNLILRKSKIKPVAVPGSVRVHDDILFVYSTNSVKLLSKTDLSTLREFDMPVPATNQDTFAVNNNWLVTPRCVYDWHTGQLMSSWDDRLEHVTLRDNVFYGLTATGLVIKDTRQNEKATHIDVDTLALGQVNLNTYGNQLYLAGNQIETYDLRYLRRMAVSPFMTQDNSSKVIDLVSMNVWTSTLIWDLIDNKWTTIHTLGSSLFTSPLVVCNGKELVCPVNGGKSLGLVELSGKAYFPYGDFKCQNYYASKEEHTTLD